MDESAKERMGEVRHELEAGIEDLRERRHQAVAQFDERIAKLEALRQQLDASEQHPRVLLEQIHQVLGDRPSASWRGPTRVTTPRIGAQPLPNQPTPRPGGVGRHPSSALAGAAMARAKESIDARVGMLIGQTPAATADTETHIELSLLRQLRRSVERHLDEMANDPVLLETLVEFGDETQRTLEDLANGGQQRVRRLLAHCRELLAELTGLGLALSAEKDELKKAQSSLLSITAAPSPNDLAGALKVALTAFHRVRPELDKRLPNAAPTLLDSLLR